MTWRPDLKTHLPLMVLAVIAVLLWAQPADAAASFAERPDVQRFVVAMANKHGFDVDELSGLFAQIKPRPRVGKTMTARVVKPAPWVRYRSNCVNSWNISHGVLGNEIRLAQSLAPRV